MASGEGHQDTPSSELRTALHRAVEAFEQDLLHIFGSYVGHLQGELQGLRLGKAREAKLKAEDSRPRRVPSGTSANVETPSSCTEDEDTLKLKPPPSKSVLGVSSRGARRGASTPTGGDAGGLSAKLALEAPSRGPVAAPTGNTATLQGFIDGPPRDGMGRAATSSDTSRNQATPQPIIAATSSNMSEWSGASMAAAALPWQITANGDPGGGSCTSSMTLYELLPLWQADGAGGSAPTSNCSRRAHLTSAATKRALMLKQHSFVGSFGSLGQQTAAQPTSPQRLVWEACGAALILYDFIVLPLQVATLIADDGRLPMTIIVATYWTCDLPLSFTVGYYINGITEIRLRKIAMNYLKTWFIPDVILVTCDWILLAIQVDTSEDDPAQLNYIKVGRGLRLLRFVRLVRLLKLKTFFTKILESFHSESILAMLHTAKLILLVVILSHCVACGWYSIGSLGKYFDDYHAETWLDVQFDGTSSLNYRYATSLHWSLTQFTPASMEVVPTNTTERAYNICIIVLAMVVFSSVVSAITEAMTHVRAMNGKKSLQHSDVRRYFSENRVSTHLTLRVWRYLLGRSPQSQRKMWRDVELLGQLPEVLQMDLHYEILMPTIGRMPFFHHCNLQNPAAMQKVCHSATEEVSVVSSQELFNCGQLADKMYFVISGHLDYIRQNPTSSGYTRLPPYPVMDGQWVCEAVIWMRWFYCGTMFARKSSSLVTLQVNKLHKILQQYENLLPQCREYARLFVESANIEQDISDTWGDFDSAQGMAQAAFVLDDFDYRRVSTMSWSSKSTNPFDGSRHALAMVSRWARGVLFRRQGS